MTRKILMISHGYPPVGGSGMLRTLKFSRYLPNYEWQPVILSLKKTHHPRLDPKLLSEVPSGTKIYRSMDLNLISALVRIRECFLRFLRRGHSSQRGASADLGKPIPKLREESSGISDFIKDLLTTPDAYCGWFLPGLMKGIWAVLRCRPHVIYSTSPPPTAHLIAASLARLTRLPWVVDFRDPWTLQYAVNGVQGRRARWNQRIEAKVFRHCQHVICNTEPMAQRYREAYPWVPPEKVTVVTNGFDPADFTDSIAPSERTDDSFLFLHTGEFEARQGLRVPDPFLEALRDLYLENLLPPGSVKVRLVGSGDYTEMEPFFRLVRSSPLAESVEVIDFLPHHAIPAQLAESNALLLFQNSENFSMQIPAKIFEYIKAERPILAVAPTGATSELVESLAGGRAVHPDDRAGMRQAILDLVASKGETFERGPEELQRFDRQVLTGKLAKVLDGLVNIQSEFEQGEKCDHFYRDETVKKS